MTTVSLLRHLRFLILKSQTVYYQVENGHDRDGLGFSKRIISGKQQKKEQKKTKLNQN